MNLIIDVGNTLSKVAVFQQDELIERFTVEKPDLSKKIEKIFSRHPDLDGVIISKVSQAEFSLPQNLQKKMPIINLDAGTRLPFENLYATPQTLGADRKALVAAAVKEYPGKSVLVIDAGTCITYDFKNEKDQYLGGAISPGLKMRFKALNSFTANLPLVEAREEAELIGDSTLTSIRSGVVKGILKEIDGVIEEYKEKYPELVTIITGGDAQFLSINLKNSIFANSNFLLEGLNHILEFNISR
ncbi:type III pantothenate kinase [Salinimicrobium catena]|uniref:Type III pantothenate kinase n=1 Tax=Salinimicrobium catena TaxID=390640 RepID=A0A1H5JZ23_9FLAO|nr:type III pantothenate kinase [Salinimicrobium catena]SDK91386.1 type III pantothenate kinase [Salinimicrobium catena]SEE57111.1 type III pantothenate kinase [Salinimicrobium catena]